ncbi:hypothetical protein ABK040_011463 [Willaertia magna]
MWKRRRRKSTYLLINDYQQQQYGINNRRNHLCDHKDSNLLERPEDIPSKGTISLDLFNDFTQLIGGIALTIGSSLYMVKPEPLYLVYTAVSNWLAGSLLFLLVACIQFGMKQYEILKTTKSSATSNTEQQLSISCCLHIGFDISSYVLNMVACLLFSMGSTCFYFVNNRSMEVTGEVIWSMGCVATVLSIVFSRIVWIENNFTICHKTQQL